MAWRSQLLEWTFWSCISNLVVTKSLTLVKITLKKLPQRSRSTRGPQLVRFLDLTIPIPEILSGKMRTHGSQCFSHIMNNGHPLQLKKSKSWEPFWSYQLTSTADLANLTQFWGKWAGLAVLFSWQLHNGPQDFDFFNDHGCRFIWAYFHWDLCAPIYWT